MHLPNVSPLPVLKQTQANHKRENIRLGTSARVFISAKHMCDLGEVRDPVQYPEARGNAGQGQENHVSVEGHFLELSLKLFLV